MNDRMDNGEHDDLDWCREHIARLESLAESDREMADQARTVLNYLRDEEDESGEFKDILYAPQQSYLSLTGIRRRARTVRNALTSKDEGDRG